MKDLVRGEKITDHVFLTLSQNSLFRINGKIANNFSPFVELKLGSLTLFDVEPKMHSSCD